MAKLLLLLPILRPHCLSLFAKHDDEHLHFESSSSLEMFDFLPVVNLAKNIISFCQFDEGKKILR